MEELCAEGLAPHGDPESCVAFCEGRGEALTGARAGLAIEPRNTQDRGARVLMSAEGNTPGSASRELPGDPARPENHGMCGTFVRENRRARACPSAWSAGGPPGERQGGNPRMDGGGKPDRSAVPASLPNEARAEAGE